MNEALQYAEFIRPAWAPPAWLFSPVWTVLYIIIVISFGWVFYQVIKGQIPKTVAVPFGLNLFFNLIYTPIQFGLQNNLLASLDIILVVVTLIWLMVAIWPHARWVTLVNIPYGLWVSFATVLQFTITYLNW
ncbi:MAG: TspO/MBR family protein [Patescibacteria group bacterium]